ncbi:MAG: hypothetical protein BWK79_17545 [Beggiatoa sp. IS2]|nr:MAG: hypothetical protein BWK79_17545 [Beggiatoa sp. IS2]
MSAIKTLFKRLFEKKWRSKTSFCKEHDSARLLELMPMGLMLFNAKGQLNYFNQTAEHLIGKSEISQLTASKWASVCRVGAQEQLCSSEQNPILQALQGKRTYCDDLKYYRLGQAMVLEVWGIPVISQVDLAAPTALLVFQDITRRKQEEAKQTAMVDQSIQVSKKLEYYLLALEQEVAEQTSVLQEREQTLRAILDATTDTILMMELDGIIVTINPTGILRLNANPYNVVGSCFYEYLPMEIAEKRRVIVDKVIRVKQPLALEDERNNRWFEMNFFPVLNPANLVERVVIFARDISGRKQAEEALRLSQFSLDHSADGIQWIRPDSLYLYVNDSFCHLVGYSRDELLSMGITDLDLHLSTTSWQDQWEEYKRKGFFTFETEYRRRDGSIFPVEITTSYLAFKGKEYLFTSVRNITERKEAERALAIANQAKSLFLTNMSHELRTPLNGILGFAQILQMSDNLNAEQREGVSVIRQSGEHLLTLIGDILDLAKIEAGKLELSLTDFRFQEFIRTIIDLFRLRAKQKGITFVYEEFSGESFEKLPLAVKTDEKRLRQILLNLLSNAIKFTEQGSVTLMTGYQRGQLHLVIKDTGIGIAPNELEAIFQPFQQVGHKSRKIEGTGLGLSITKKLVETMGGRLQVESVVNQGSLFKLILPIQCSATQLSEPVKIAKIIGYRRKDEIATQQPIIILIVDDSRENRLVLVSMLKKLGFTLFEAADGQEALEKVRIHHPHIILMDLMMPKMNGFDCTRRIRQQPELQNVVVIALSASVFARDRQDSLEAGCHEFLPKPVDRNHLLQLLATHCQLDWIYEPSPVGELNAESPIVCIKGPPLKQANDLLDLVKLGDIQALVERSQEFAEQSPELQPFVQEIHLLAKDFKMRQLQKFIEQFIEE